MSVIRWWFTHPVTVLLMAIACLGLAGWSAYEGEWLFAVVDGVAAVALGFIAGLRVGWGNE